MATARKLSIEYPKLKFLLVEKEKFLAMHQTGHNSGVIHAGIYYTPGSLKAKLCVEGLEATYKYCDEHSIPYKKVGKLIVAVNQEEVNRLDGLYERGLKNNVRDLRLVDAKQIKEIEPNCTGLKAIHSPHTGTKLIIRKLIQNKHLKLYVIVCKVLLTGDLLLVILVKFLKEMVVKLSLILKSVISLAQMILNIQLE